MLDGVTPFPPEFAARYKERGYWEGRSLSDGFRDVFRRYPDRIALIDDDGPVSYERYGFRVPAVIVSPYARPGYVCSTVLDHTSVLRLVEEKWNLPALTARDAAANMPLDALDLDGPPAFLEPPSLPEPALKWGTW